MNLVTGANGFVGSHLVEELLRQGHAVRCLVRPTSDVRWLTGLPVELSYGDVGDAGSLDLALSGVDIAYHVAGMTRARRPSEFHQVNATGTANLLEAAARRTSPPRVVYVSSIAAAGPGPRDRPLREADVPRPISDYGRSKRAGERHAERLADRVPVTVVRPPIVYGPRDHDVLILFRLAQLGVFPQAGVRAKKLSVIHVRDLVRALVAAGTRGAVLGRSGGAGGVYFVADTGPYGWADLARAAATALGGRVRVIPLPNVCLLAAGTVGELIARSTGRPGRFSLDKAVEGAARNWSCSADRAAAELGFARRFDLQAGFHDTVAWYRAQGWL